MEFFGEKLARRAIEESAKLRRLSEIGRDCLDEGALYVLRRDPVAAHGVTDRCLREPCPGRLFELARRFEPVDILVGAKRFGQILAAVRIEIARGKPARDSRTWALTTAGSSQGGSSSGGHCVRTLVNRLQRQRYAEKWEPAFRPHPELSFWNR